MRIARLRRDINDTQLVHDLAHERTEVSRTLAGALAEHHRTGGERLTEDDLLDVEILATKAAGLIRRLAGALEMISHPAIARRPGEHLTEWAARFNAVVDRKLDAAPQADDDGFDDGFDDSIKYVRRLESCAGCGGRHPLARQRLDGTPVRVIHIHATRPSNATPSVGAIGSVRSWRFYGGSIVYQVKLDGGGDVDVWPCEVTLDLARAARWQRLADEPMLPPVARAWSEVVVVPVVVPCGGDPVCICGAGCVPSAPREPRVGYRIDGSHEPACASCGERLMFSARERGDHLCGPCSFSARERGDHLCGARR